MTNSVPSLERAVTDLLSVIPTVIIVVAVIIGVVIWVVWLLFPFLVWHKFNVLLREQEKMNARLQQIDIGIGRMRRGESRTE